MNGEGAGIPPAPVADPFEDPLTPCTPVGPAAPVMLAAADEETLLATPAVAVAIADFTDALNALLEL